MSRTSSGGPDRDRKSHAMLGGQEGLRCGRTRLEGGFRADTEYASKEVSGGREREEQDRGEELDGNLR